MPLVLNYREVAQANIDHFDRLGAFHGFEGCRYHYTDTDGNSTKFGCAIGIMDTEGLTEDNGVEAATSL